MKRTLIIISAVVLTLLIAVITLPFLIPASVYTAQIEKAATSALGREVTLTGDARISVFPSISARIDGAKVANPDGFEGDYMIEAGVLKASVKLWPLLSRRVEIGEITLSDATVRLERLIDGRANWEFGSEGEEQPDTPPQDGSGDGVSTKIARARLNNAAVYFHDRQTEQKFALTEFNFEARLTALDEPFTSQGDGRVNGQAFEYDITLGTIERLTTQQAAQLDIDLVTDYGRVQYDGELTLNEVPSFDGQFEINSSTIGNWLGLFVEDLPIKTSEIEALNASGTISGPVSGLVLDFSKLDLDATGLSFGYTGKVNLTETPTLNGSITIKADRPQRLLIAGHPMLTALAAIGKLDLSARISGDVAGPSLSNIVLKQRSNLLSTDYTGSASLSGDRALTGSIKTSSSDLRGLLNSLNVELVPGETLKTMSLSGNLTGSLTDITLSNGDLALDDLQATGSLGADLGGTRPRITADLTMPSLDLTPLLGDGADASDTQPSLDEDWNDDPLALDSLNLVDATINIKASRVVLDQITLTDAVLKTRLDNGRLSAIFRQDEDQPGFKAFDGNWSGDLVLDASHATPTLEIEAIADTITAQKMLGALTGFDRLLGVGDVHVDLTSSGNSLKALVSGLDGRMEADLSNGALRGLNLAKLVRDTSNIQDLLRNGDLTIASFREAFSPDAETDFTNFITALQFNNGVAHFTNLRLDNPVVAVIGSGSIDLGARTIDIRLNPKIDVSAQRQGSGLSLGDIPVPVRVYGSWSNIKYELDLAAVQTELTARARGALVDEITDQVGGPLGGILGEVLGGGSAQPAPKKESTPSPTEAEPETATEATPPSLEDELTNLALGAIFGSTETQDEKVPEPIESETVD